MSRGYNVVKVGDKEIGESRPVYVIAEIGINHNGSLELAKQMIDGAVAAGCDAVKFQKRTPEWCVPKHQWDVERDTPWGRMRYIDYKHKIEFDSEQFDEIDEYCRMRSIAWFASAWDLPSVKFLERYDMPCYKVASASLTDRELLDMILRTNRPIMLSTGMSTFDEIRGAVSQLDPQRLLLAHATSAYPCPPEALNISAVRTLKRLYSNIPVGYSGHEQGIQPSLAAVALGATFVERHVTLDRNMWGTDQKGSIDMNELATMARHIRDLEVTLGDGVKRVYDCELSSKRKLRRVPGISDMATSTPAAAGM